MLIDEKYNTNIIIMSLEKSNLWVKYSFEMKYSVFTLKAGMLNVILIGTPLTLT